MEALSKGIPCIVSSNCAAIDSIEIGYNGLSFKNNDERDLELSIRKILDNSYIKRLSENAYKKYWEKDNSIENYIHFLIKIYYNIISNKRR
mgnify:CR=1 FL=1